MTKQAPIVGIDLGGTNMQIGVVDAGGTIIGTARKKTNSKQGAEGVLDRLTEGVAEACADAGIAVTDLEGLGIGAPGAIDPARGLVLEAVNLRWNDFPLRDELSSRLKIPVVVDNDVNVGLYGEFKQGAGKGVNDLIGVWVGTGIGGGMILNGKLFHGPMFTAGEIGHTTLFPNMVLASRTLEQCCSRTAVANRLTSLVLANEPSVLSEKILAGDMLKSKSLARAYHDHDVLTVRVIDEVADLIGISIANLVTFLSVTRIVLGGGLTEAAGTSFVDRVGESARRHAFPDRCADALEVVASTLEDDAGVVGAAWLARESLEA